MQGFPSLQRFSPLQLPTFPPPQCHLPTFSGDGEGWQIALSGYNFQVPSVAHHLGSEAFQPAEPSSGCRLPHHRSDLHPDHITAAPAGENIPACNQVPLLSAGLTVLCCERLGKSIKSSPKSPGKVTMSGVTHANFLAAATLNFCKESLRRPGSGGQSVGSGLSS